MDPKVRSHRSQSETWPGTRTHGLESTENDGELYLNSFIKNLFSWSVVEEKREPKSFKFLFISTLKVTNLGTLKLFWG